MVDETEARWQRYLKTYPTLKYVDVYWESTPGLSTYTYDNAVRMCMYVSLLWKAFNKLLAGASCCTSIRR